MYSTCGWVYKAALQSEVYSFVSDQSTIFQVSVQLLSSKSSIMKVLIVIFALVAIVSISDRVKLKGWN